MSQVHMNSAWTEGGSHEPNWRVGSLKVHDPRLKRVMNGSRPTLNYPDASPEDPIDSPDFWLKMIVSRALVLFAG